MKQIVTETPTLAARLDAKWADFVATNVDQGRYGDTTAVLEVALSLLEDHENKVQEATAAVMSGAELESALWFDIPAFLAAEDRLQGYLRAD